MEKNINVGFVAHVDAGKTTLTENLLFISGASRKMGKVDDGTSTTDYLGVEKRRGISVKASSVTIQKNGVQINVIDAPGHVDFISEVERTLAALDVAVLVVSAVEGVQAQTKTLLRAFEKLSLPAIIFINKIDRAGANYQKVKSEIRKILSLNDRNIVSFNVPDGGKVVKNENFCDDVSEAISSYDEKLFEDYLSGDISEDEIYLQFEKYFSEGKIYPVFCGSGKLGTGTEELLSFLSSFPVKENSDDELSGYVYKVEHDKTLGKVAHVRLFSGTLKSRDTVKIASSGEEMKITQIKRIQGSKLIDIAEAQSGELCAICGSSPIKAGDFIGKAQENRVCEMSLPMFSVKAVCDDDKRMQLLKIANELSDEDPSLHVEWVSEKKELTIRTTGKIQLETLKEIIMDRYALKVDFTKPSVIYKETPKTKGYGFECYTMPKPCWAVVHFFIEPLPAGSGVQYEANVSEKQIKYKYQEHIKTSLFDSLKQGLMGWEVTDCKFTLIGGEDHVQHTHPLDFFVATPMAVMDGLRNCSVTLLEPIMSVSFTCDMSSENKVLALINSKRGTLIERENDGESVTLTAEIPVGETFDLYEEFASLTSGKGICQSTFARYSPVPEGMGEARERVGVNPLDRAKWILHARQAL